MHTQLAAVDAATAKRLSPNDSQRIQRALEVYRITAVPLSTLQTRGRPVSGPLAAPAFGYPTLSVALLPSVRSQLHTRIEQRFDAMLDAGLIDEVRRLRASHQLMPELPSMRMVGYRHVWRFLEGEISDSAMRDQAIAATRQLAKRQMTWLRSMPQVEPFDCLDASAPAAVVARMRQWLQSAAGS
jgi:tRNA dimethylallyltransferase